MTRRVLLIDGPGRGTVVESDGTPICYADPVPVDPCTGPDFDPFAAVDFSRHIVTYQVHRVLKYDWEMWIGTCRGYDDHYLDALNQMNFSDLIGRGLLRKRIASGPAYGLTVYGGGGGGGGFGNEVQARGGAGGGGECAYIGPPEGRPSPYAPGGIVPQPVPERQHHRCSNGCRYLRQGYPRCENGECVENH